MNPPKKKAIVDNDFLHKVNEKETRMQRQILELKKSNVGFQLSFMKLQEEREKMVKDKIVLIGKLKELQHKFISLSPYDDQSSCQNVGKCSFLFRNDDPECFRCIYCGTFENPSEKTERSTSMDYLWKDKRDASTSENQNTSNSKTSSKKN